MLIYGLFLLTFLIAVTLRRDISILISRVTIIILIYCTIICINCINLTSIDKGIGLYGGLFHSTCNTHVFYIFIYLVSTTIILLTGFYPRKVWKDDYSNYYLLFAWKIIYSANFFFNKMGQQYKILEYSLIILFIVTGAVFLLSTSDIVSVFLCIELQSYGLYILSTIYRNSELATSAGLTYFLLGGLSSCFILLATSLLYANTGTTSFDGIYLITNISDISENSNNITMLYIYKANYINYCLIIMSVGFLFKVSAAPFHFWSPDVYDAIPTIVTTYVAIVGKISLFVFFLELVHYTSNTFFSLKFTWTISLLLSSFFSLIVGTTLGLTQYRIKRLFAYSTIAHIGFILLALSINSIESIQAFIFYIMQYSISNLNAFILLISKGYFLYFYINNNKQYNKLYDKNNSPIQLISQIKGYFYLNPLLSISLAITIFSFVGIPPLIGFFAKQMVLSAALDRGFVFLTLIAIITSVISGAYYLAIIKQVFFDNTDYKIDTKLKNFSFFALVINNAEYKLPLLPLYNTNNIVLSSSLTVTISILTLIILLFIFIPQEWLSMANILAIILFNI